MSFALIWIITLASIALMLLRPWGIPEVVWTSAGALSLCLLRLIPWSLARHAVAEGVDVYLFLAGMMLLSELAKVQGVFDWLAGIAVKRGDGSPRRLFTLIYSVGTVVTIFMSNDATAVVLTPAVLSAIKQAGAKPMPYLLACAMIANAASFVLPISNPANLVVFHNAMPPLPAWLRMFALPSLVAVVSTYGLLRWYSRRELQESCRGAAPRARLSHLGKISLGGILVVAAVLLIASALKLDLGLPTCLAAVAVACVAWIWERSNPIHLLRQVSWSVLPLVAALFVMLEAVQRAGAAQWLHTAFVRSAAWPPAASAFALGGAVGFGTNLVNNLPLGLIVGTTLRSGSFPHLLEQTVLVGVDLGPNLSVTGSLATILWLMALRRQGLHVSSWEFMKAGLFILPISLLLTIAAIMLLQII